MIDMTTRDSTYLANGLENGVDDGDVTHDATQRVAGARLGQVFVHQVCSV
jgi:hypothetical protein